MKTMPFSEFAQANPKVSLTKKETYPYVDMAAVTPGKRYVMAQEERQFKSGGSKFQTSDTLFARITPCLENGKIAQFVGDRKDSVGFGSTEFFVFRARENVSDPAYLFYLCQTDSLRKPAEKSMAGASGRQRADLNTVLSVEVRCPPLPTQRKIASILSAYDDLIENNTRRIAILEEMAQAIYREWFVNFRFPGHENVKLVDSELGQIPEGWEVGKLEDVLVLQRGFDLPKKNRVEGHVPIYASTGVTGLHNEAKVEGPGVLTGRSGSLGTVTYIHEDFWPLNTTLWIKNFKWGSPVFAFYVLSGIDFETFNSGAAVPSLNRNNVHGLPTLLPKREVIADFDEIATDVFDQAKLLRRKNENLRTTRDLLLPKLISGKLDVEDLDIDVGLLSEELNQQAKREPREKARTFNSGAGRSEAKAKEAKRQKSAIDEIETESVMIEFRQAARKLGTTNREDLIKTVSKGLGYKRIGIKIQESLKGHLRAAIRRKIIGASGDEVWPETPAMDSYTRDELVDTLKSVMRKNQRYERDDVIRLVANYLGFKRVSKTLQKPVKSAITGAIRRQILNYEGSTIWREN